MSLGSERALETFMAILEIGRAKINISEEHNPNLELL